MLPTEDPSDHGMQLSSARPLHEPLRPTQLILINDASFADRSSHLRRRPIFDAVERRPNSGFAQQV
jgi:hypothetical protein